MEAEALPSVHAGSMGGGSSSPSVKSSHLGGGLKETPCIGRLYVPSDVILVNPITR